MRPSFVLSSVLALSLTVACGGGGGDGGGVTPPPVTAASVVVTPSNDTTLTVGATRAFTATPRNAAGQAMTGRTITWTTSSAGAASISTSSGSATTATAAGAGTTTIRATVDGRTDEVVLTVQAAPPVVASVLITPGADVSIAQNATLNLSAIARDAANVTIAGTAISWSSTNTLVASVSAATGASITVTPGTTGSARIIASAAGRADTVNVTVTTSGLATTATVNMLGLTFSPSLVNLAAGGTVTWTNASNTTHNVTFLSGPAVTGGNIPNHIASSNDRTLTAVGTYGYECTIHTGMTGSVVVQ